MNAIFSNWKQTEVKRRFLHHTELYYIVNLEINNGDVQTSTGEQKID